MPDSMPTLDEAAHAEAYRGIRERVTEMLRIAPPPLLDARAPATPKWRARDVASHLVGVAADVVSGNIADAAADHWTAAQVDARYDHSIEALLDEWAETGPQVDAIILALPTSITGQLIADTVTHEHDLRNALGRPGARESEALTIAVTWVVGALGQVYDASGVPATRFESETVAATAGAGAPDATVRATTFELGRAIAGRRTIAEIAAFGWTPAPHPDRVVALPFFTPPAVSIGEE